MTDRRAHPAWRRDRDPEATQGLSLEQIKELLDERVDKAVRAKPTPRPQRKSPSVAWAHALVLIVLILVVGSVLVGSLYLALLYGLVH